MRDLQRMTVCVAITVLLSGAAQAVWAQDINQDMIKKGMSLNDVVLAFGQPAQIEWVNLSGTSVLFIFYPTDQSDDAVVRQQDGRLFLPMGFVTEALAGWGKDFYEQNRSPQLSPGPNAP